MKPILTILTNHKRLLVRLSLMRKATSFFAALILSNCVSAQTITTEKAGVNAFFPPLSYVPSRTFLSLSHEGSDSLSTYQPRSSSVAGFYISQCELTNREYRAFVSYVRDSLAHSLLGHFEKDDRIDWKREINWNDWRLDPLMIPPEERAYGFRALDPGKLVYQLIVEGQKRIVPVCPDTLVWINDFAYSYNEPLVKRYFSHTDYDNYPVAGVSLWQAMAYCQWKTEQVNARSNNQFRVTVRLPSNAEWESAALAEKDSFRLRGSRKGFSFNFGPIIDANGITLKTYEEDGFFYTAPVKSFTPGAYGIFDMKGNVSEWTSTGEDEIRPAATGPGKSHAHFIAKGGGWNSAVFYTQAGACQFFEPNEQHSFLGFRYVVYITRKS